MERSLPLGLIPGVGGPEILIIFFVILLLFGAKKLPELARGLGKSIKEFKKAATEVEGDLKSAMEAAEPGASGENEKREQPEQAPRPAKPDKELQG